MHRRKRRRSLSCRRTHNGCLRSSVDHIEPKTGTIWLFRFVYEAFRMIFHVWATFLGRAGPIMFERQQLIYYGLLQPDSSLVSSSEVYGLRPNNYDLGVFCFLVSVFCRARPGSWRGCDNYKWPFASQTTIVLIENYQQQAATADIIFINLFSQT